MIDRGAHVGAVLEDAPALPRGSRVDRCLAWAWLLPIAFYGALQVWFALRPFDVAQGRPFHASSQYEGYPIEGSVRMRSPGNLLFHTLEEESPWVEVDLGEERLISRVEVRNRSDCCGDRAVPIVVEVRRAEHEPWVIKARRDRPFVVWVADVRGATARYVRVRAPRRTSLHLEGLGVR